MSRSRSDGAAGGKSLAQSLASIARQAQRHEQDGATRYLAIAAALRGAVDDGTWQPGSRLPSDTTLASKLPGSLVTIQKALAKLEEDGVVVRQSRIGTFVRDVQLRDPDIRHVKFLLGSSSEHLPVTVRIAGISSVASDPYWGAAHREGAKYVKVRRHYTIGSEFRMYLDTHLPQERFGALLKAKEGELDGLPLTNLLRSRFNCPIIRTDHLVRLDTPIADARTWLQLAPGEGVVRWRMYSHTHNDELVMYQDGFVPKTEAWIQIVAK